MPDATQLIAEIIRKKNLGILNGNQAMRRILEQLLEQVRSMLGNASISGWDQFRMKQLQQAIQQALNESERRMQQALSGELTNMWTLGQDAAAKPLELSGVYSGGYLPSSLLETLESFTFQKISGVARDAYQKISAELTMGLLGYKTPQQVAEAIGENLSSPGVFKTIADRSEVITKTDMGRTFSLATNYRLQQTAEYVPDLEKQWIHAGHPQRARVSHLVQDGRHVPYDQPFGITDDSGYKLMFAHDPNADIGETINCGCDTVPWKKEWGLPERSGLSGMIYDLAGMAA